MRSGFRGGCRMASAISPARFASLRATREVNGAAAAGRRKSNRVCTLIPQFPVAGAGLKDSARPDPRPTQEIASTAKVSCQDPSYLSKPAKGGIWTQSAFLLDRERPVCLRLRAAALRRLAPTRACGRSLWARPKEKWGVIPDGEVLSGRTPETPPGRRLPPWRPRGWKRRRRGSAPLRSKPPR